MSFINLFSLLLSDMNTSISTALREEGGVANERVHPRVYQVPIVDLGQENEEVPLQESQVSPMPQAPFVEG